MSEVILEDARFLRSEVVIWHARNVARRAIIFHGWTFEENCLADKQKEAKK